MQTSPTSCSSRSATSDCLFAAPASGDADLLSRVARLEAALDQATNAAQRARRSARRWSLGAIVGTALGAMALMAAGLPDSFAVVRTKRLEIVDDQNRVVGLMTVGSDGGQFDLWSTGGANVARIAATPKGGDFSMWNAAGRPAVGAFVGDAGGRFEVYDEGGRAMGRMNASRTGGELVLQTSLGKPGIIAKADDRGGGIAACDAVGRPLAELSSADGAGLVLVADQNARAVATLKSTERGGAIELTDSRGTAAFSAGADVGGGSFTVHSPEGRALLTGGASPSGGGSLEVRTVNGEPVVSASTGEGMTGRIIVSNPDGQRGIALQGTSGSYGIAILEATRRVLLLEGNSGGGRMEITDLGGRASVVAGIDAEAKSGTISLRDTAAKEIVRISADEKGNGRTAVYTRSGEDRKIYGVK